MTMQVCSKATFKPVKPITIRGLDRLIAPGLETMALFDSSYEASKKDSIKWPRRLRNHCKYLLKHLQNRDLYEMWLRTSVGGVKHGSFEGFLCFGEGIFSDCVDRDRVIAEAGKKLEVNWPGGDEPEEDEEIEEVSEINRALLSRRAS